MTVSRTVIIALLGVIALASFGLAWVVFDLGRSGDMRDAEADFASRLRDGNLAAPVAPATPSPTIVQRSAESEQEELAEWYAASDDSSAPAGGSAD